MNENITQTEGKKDFWYYYDKLVDYLALLSGVALLGISFVIVADVTMRYAFNKPFSFTMCTGEIILVLVLAFGGTYLLRVQDFIRVDIVMQFMPKRIQLVFRCITDFLAAIVFWVICYGATVKCIELYKTKAIIVNSGGNWRHWVYMAPMVIFYLVIPFQFIRNSLHAINTYKKEKKASKNGASQEAAEADAG